MTSTVADILSNYLAYEDKRFIGGAYECETDYRLILTKVRHTHIYTTVGTYDSSQVGTMFANQGAANAIEKDIAVHGRELVNKAATELFDSTWAYTLLNP